MGLRVLTVCGSLRAASVNRRLLAACARLAPAGVQVLPPPDLGQLPLFNPDLEAQPPVAVQRWRGAVAQADALLIASPEYAHGVTGVLKNALDWLVGFEAFAGKRVALLNASPRAFHAQDALREILRTMSAHVVEAACAGIPLPRCGLDEAGMVNTPAVAEAIRKTLDALPRC